MNENRFGILGLFQACENALQNGYNRHNISRVNQNINTKVGWILISTCIEANLIDDN